ncbi:GNAT family N-acetyltransferase [Streptomyces sp. NPDC050560]|uniref:GNAT family N-acetyltransferase n=1 Tax=Streptomyces sp. NPDC050560 TaxID=3365630 RepID=UPI0037B9C6F7
MCADIDVRRIGRDELTGWLRAVNTGFLKPPTPADDLVEDYAGFVDFARTQGAYDGDRCVGTFRSFPQTLTAPGGAPVRASAVSNVTVTPTHRRRGLLGRMMAAEFEAARERGDQVATLIAAEHPIYGRYGFGPAASLAEWEIDVPRAGLDPRWPGPREGRVALVDPAEVREAGPALFDRFRAGQHGAVDRSERWWRRFTGLGREREQERGGKDAWTEPFHALYTGPDGEPEGLVTYRADGRWGDAKQPLVTAEVSDLFAVTPRAERALWHYVCAVDWVTRVRTGYRAVDDLVPHLLPDPRAARVVTRSDWLWVRLLDIPGALAARSYPAAGSLVLGVTAPDGPGGRYLLDASPQGATCEPTSRPAALTLDVGALATLWMGDDSAPRLAALGLVAEAAPGALATADALFRVPRAPWCPDMF